MSRTGQKRRNRVKLSARILLTLLVVSVAMVGVGVAQDGDEAKEELNEQFTQMADLIIFLIAAVAVPNGAYGLFEWMTAGADQEKNEKGIKRIRNTFIGLAGAAVIKVAVELVTAVLGV